jgi:hypothetical protein
VSVVILWLDIGDVEKAITADGEVDKRGLDRGLDIDDFAFVDVTGVTLVAGALDVEFLKEAVFDDCDSALLGLEHINQHFLLHAVSF